MLTVRLSKGILSAPQLIKGVSSVVIEDEHGQPIHAFLMVNESSVLSVSPADANFHQILEDMGIKKRCDYEVR